MTTREKRSTKKRRVIKGTMSVIYKNPLTQTQVYNIKDIDSFLNRDDNIMIYMDDEPIPFLMKRSYFANILFDDIVYHCSSSRSIGKTSSRSRTSYYHLFKLFVNHPEYQDVILSTTEMDNIVKNRHINKYHIYSANRAINTIPKINVDLKTDPHEDVTNEENLGEILNNLSYYAEKGYNVANSYLIRTTEYPERRKLPEYANDIADIELASLIRFLSCCFNFETRKITQCYQHVRNRAVERMIRDMDLAFMKIAPRCEPQGMTLRRGVWNYYPYLKKIGDKMVIENYISATKRPDTDFGNKKYIIHVSPGIPYIDENEIFKDVFIYPQEREVILPKNLLAELIDIHQVEDYDHPFHTIRLSLLYDGQFDLGDETCKPRNLYHIEPFIHRGNYSAKSARSARSNKRSTVVSNSV